MTSLCDDPRHPYFDDRPYRVGICKLCGQPVRDFEEWAENGRDVYHMDCLDQLNLKRVIREMGGEIHD